MYFFCIKEGAMKKTNIDQKQVKTILEVNKVYSKELKTHTVSLINNVNSIISSISDEGNGVIKTNDFVSNVSHLLDEYETVLELILSSLVELQSEKRTSVIKKYKQHLYSKKDKSIKSRYRTELNKESIYVSSVLNRGIATYDFLYDKIIQIDSILKSKPDHNFNVSQSKDIKELLFDLFSLSIFDGGLKRLVNDIVSYKVCDINGKLVLTLR